MADDETCPRCAGYLASPPHHGGCWCSPEPETPAPTVLDAVIAGMERRRLPSSLIDYLKQRRQGHST